MEAQHRIGLHIALQGGVAVGLTGIKRDLDHADHAAIALGLAAFGIAPARRIVARPSSPAPAAPDQAMEDNHATPQQWRDTPLHPAPVRAAAIASVTVPMTGGMPVSPGPPPTSARALVLATLAHPIEAASPPAHQRAATLSPPVFPPPIVLPSLPTLQSAAPPPIGTGAAPGESLSIAPRPTSAGNRSKAAPSVWTGTPDAAQTVPQQTPSADPQSNPSDAQPYQEGRLILDGAVLGRWIIDHLTREIDRPTAAGTAVDPRMGRNWPGPL